MDISPELLNLHKINYRQHRHFVNADFVNHIQNHGQLNSVKVVESKGQLYVIDGWRRVLAARQLQINVSYELVANDINSILFDFGEVCKRSDYEQYISLEYIISQSNITCLQLGELLNISKARIYNLFSFKYLDKDLVEAIEDFRLVSCSTAKEIRSIQKSQEGLQILITLAEEIRLGLGSTQLRREVLRLKKQNDREDSTQLLLDDTAKPIGVYRGSRQFTFDDALIDQFGTSVLQNAIKEMVIHLRQKTLANKEIGR